MILMVDLTVVGVNGLFVPCCGVARTDVHRAHPPPVLLNTSVRRLLDEWVRFHHLFATFARTSLEVERPEPVPHAPVVVNGGSLARPGRRRGAHLLAGDAYDEATRLI